MLRMSSKGCTMSIEQRSSLDEIFSLLPDCGLPVSNISASSPPQFFGIRDVGCLVAVIGLEQFQSIGLLRSLAVVPDHRGGGLARELVVHVESFATSRGIESLSC